MNVIIRHVVIVIKKYFQNDLHCYLLLKVCKEHRLNRHKRVLARQQRRLAWFFTFTQHCSHVLSYP